MRCKTAATEQADLSWCSQTRIVRMPLNLSAAPTFFARLWVLASFARQKVERVLGMWPHFGQACQKQPSTNTASLSLGK